MIDIKKLFELIAQRVNTPTNVKLPVHAVVKEIPDHKHGQVTTLVFYNTADKDSSAIDERIIDDVDLYEQKIIEDAEGETAEYNLIKLQKVYNKARQSMTQEDFDSFIVLAEKMLSLPLKCQDCGTSLNVGEEISDCETCNKERKSSMLCEACAEKHMKQGHLVTFRVSEEAN